MPYAPVLNTARRKRQALAGLTVTAVLAAGALGTSTGAIAADEPPSTPVPIATPDGQISSYVLNAQKQKPNQTAAVARAVRRAGGTVIQTWPQIGVVVAHSTDADFREEVVEHGPVASVGPTRTVAVKEGTPGAATTGSSRMGARAARRASPRASSPTPRPRTWSPTRARPSSGT